MRASKILATVVGALAFAIAGFASGYSLADRQGMERLETEVAGNLSLHVQMASELRAGDAATTLDLLDDSVDRAVTSLARHDRVPAVASALGRAKTYRSQVPSSSPAVNEALRQVEAVSLESCQLPEAESVRAALEMPADASVPSERP